MAVPITEKDSYPPISVTGLVDSGSGNRSSSKLSSSSTSRQ